MDYRLLRELIRNLQPFEALAENDGITVLTAPGGEQHSLHDIQYLYGCRTMLSPRQSQAIQYCLYEGMREKDVALLMGLNEGSPVAIYAAQGLRRLCELIQEGRIERYGPDERPALPDSAGYSRALGYAARGIPVVPLWWLDEAGSCGCRRSCGEPGTHPVIAAWKSAATTNSGMIARWWKSWPLARVGFALRSLDSFVLAGDLLSAAS